MVNLKRSSGSSKVVLTTKTGVKLEPSLIKLDPVVKVEPGLLQASLKRPPPRNKQIVPSKLLKIDDINNSDNDDDDYFDESSGKPINLNFSKIRLPLNNRIVNNNLRTPGMGIVSFKTAFTMPTFVKGGDRPIGAVRGGTQLGVTKRNNIVKGCLYDPEAEGALILHTPKLVSIAEELEALKSTFLKTAPEMEIHVIVDPTLSKVLRPHQIEGVKFLYDCVMGKKKDGCYGCIMADEMGLGKTLQCITLLWTLLKQSPIAGKPTLEKVVIACPSSLVKNWANELKKWLGADRIHPYACDNKGTKQQTMRDLEHFTNVKGRTVSQPVLIISYDTLRNYTEILKRTEIGLLLCDEGHKLKNGDSLTYVALNSLNAKRRVILSGTPIQNDLTEYFSLLTFAIPGVLGTASEFRKNFENPILRGRDSMCSDKDKEKGEEKMKELLAIANQFIIRRTASLLTKYLPIKYEHVVFCKLSPLQNSIYQSFAQSKEVKRLLNGVGNVKPLQYITNLKKLCNHPILLANVEGGGSGGYSSRAMGKKSNTNVTMASEDIKLSLYPENFDFTGCQSEFSGKMLLLEKMMIKMRKETDDKIVLISNYTQTLDLFDKMCRMRRWGVLRLDGSLTIQKRSNIVDQFNNPLSSEFVLLLSSKAGGCGLNLIGANRLVLFDPDWNPANDGQALARVWRDGQKKVCYIYRFIATGSIEEKIFQRQAHKQSLSSCVVDEEENVERHFSLESLRQLFTLNSDTLCDTHDTFKGKQVHGPANGGGGTGAGGADTSNWNHYSELETHKIHDSVLKECAPGIVSFVFQNKSHEPIRV